MVLIGMLAFFFALAVFSFMALRSHREGALAEFAILRDRIDALTNVIGQRAGKEDAQVRVAQIAADTSQKLANLDIQRIKAERELDLQRAVSVLNTHGYAAVRPEEIANFAEKCGFVAMPAVRYNVLMEAIRHRTSIDGTIDEMLAKAGFKVPGHKEKPERKPHPFDHLFDGGS